jgi:NAD(P)-dependent dehydrogenase (short-subunit alcohol dehydrogenase family)
MKRYRALLTGASGGIGREIAKALAPHCDDLLLVGRDARRLAETAAAAGPVARTLVADLATPAGRDAAVLPGINLLINNAGANEFAWLEAERRAPSIIETNVLAPMQLTRRLLPGRAPARGLDRQRRLDHRPGYPAAAYCATSSRSRIHRGAAPRERRYAGTRTPSRAARNPFTARTAPASARSTPNRRGDGRARRGGALTAAAPRAAGARAASRMPERLFARLNQVLPGLVDRALRRQLSIIRRHASNEGGIE